MNTSSPTAPRTRPPEGTPWLASTMLALRMMRRAPMRSMLAVLGIATAACLFCAERSIHGAIADATESTGRETRLVVYRANRFCPFTSRLPERYAGEILEIDGVRSAVPMQIVVSNCRASLDVVVFRGVRRDDARAVLAPRLAMTEGSIEAFLLRDDAAIVGRTLAERRRLRVGDRLVSAGVAVSVAGIAETDSVQDSNACFVHLPFLQSAAGGAQGGEVTQLEVEVDDPARLDAVAAAIDERFATDRAPTSTRAEKAFVARAAEDLVAVARFASWLGIGALATIFALVANAIVLSLEGRARDIAILQAIGFRSVTVLWTVLVESLALALAGGLLGATAAQVALALGGFGIGTEGVVVSFEPSWSAAIEATAAAALAGLLAGIVPAVIASRRSIAEGARLA